LIFILWLAALLLLIQLIYWTIFYIGLSKTIQPGQAIGVPISVIVCAHDEEQNLRELLPLLLKQNHHEFEVIIVNDRSNDGTYDFLLEETRMDARLKMVNVNFKPEHMNGKKYGLTLGIKAAKYDCILLTDADCRPASADWIRQMAGGFSDSVDIVLGYSPYITQAGWLNTFIRFETITTAVQYFSLTLMGNPYMGVGRNLAYRKKVFLDNKGFNGHIGVTGGDDDLFVNQHADTRKVFVVLGEKATVFSKPKKTWSEFFTQKIRHLAVGKHYKLKHKILLGPFTLSWTLLWPVVACSLFTIYREWILAGIFIRWGSQVLTVSTFGKKSGEKFEVWKIPFLDFIFGFYYLVAGFKALVSKRIPWKT
jgi:cellulose synthase/poly-beta-1,6-N-acetylglucosamine synthase-like glycosyltransferase